MLNAVSSVHAFYNFRTIFRIFLVTNWTFQGEYFAVWIFIGCVSNFSIVLLLKLPLCCSFRCVFRDYQTSRIYLGRGWLAAPAALFVHTAGVVPFLHSITIRKWIYLLQKHIYWHDILQHLTLQTIQNSLFRNDNPWSQVMVMFMIINCIRDEPGSRITMCTDRWRMNQGLLCRDRIKSVISCW